MRFLLLRDRRPGHLNQVEGLAKALARRASISVDRLDLSPRGLGRGFFRLKAFPFLASNPPRALRLMFGIDIAAIARADVVVASGDTGFLAAALLRRCWPGTKAVHCGYLPGVPMEDCDVMIVSSPRLAFKAKCVLAPIPNLVDPDGLPAPRALRSIADMRGAAFSLLIGGEAEGYAYSESDWTAVVDFVAATAAAHAIRWAVSTSRRTPGAVADRFAALSAAGTIGRFIDVRNRGSEPADPLFAADAIFVTEDSRSMVAESLAARRPTVVVGPAERMFSAGSEDVVALAAGGGAIFVTAPELDPDATLQALIGLRPLSVNAADLLAAAVAPRLGL